MFCIKSSALPGPYNTRFNWYMRCSRQYLCRSRGPVQNEHSRDEQHCPGGSSTPSFLTVELLRLRCKYMLMCETFSMWFSALMLWFGFQREWAGGCAEYTSGIRMLDICNWLTWIRILQSLHSRFLTPIYLPSYHLTIVSKEFTHGWINTSSIL